MRFRKMLGVASAVILWRRSPADGAGGNHHRNGEVAGRSAIRRRIRAGAEHQDAHDLHGAERSARPLPHRESRAGRISRRHSRVDSGRNAQTGVNLGDADSKSARLLSLQEGQPCAGTICRSIRRARCCLPPKARRCCSPAASSATDSRRAWPRCSATWMAGKIACSTCAMPCTSAYPWRLTDQNANDVAKLSRQRVRQQRRCRCDRPRSCPGIQRQWC